MMKRHNPAGPGSNSVADKAHQLFAEGLHLHLAGHIDKALRQYEQVLKLAPKHFDALHKSGIAAFQKKDYTVSVRFLLSALAVNPHVAGPYLALGNTLKEMQQLDEALLNYDRAIALGGSDADAYYNRGAALHAAGRLEESLDSYDKAIALNDQDVQAWHSRAVVLKDLAQHAQAMASVLRALAINPGHVEAHWGKALLDLQLGQFTEGWRGYEARWAMPSLNIVDGPRPGGPVWLGQESLQGKTILLTAEQGLGDTLQFCRYVPLVAQRGARVVLEVPAPLAGLLGSLDGISTLLVKGAQRPSYDYHCSLMSLPLAFGTQLDSIPDTVPYLSASPDKVAHWSAQLGEKTKPRVGVVWRGNSLYDNDSRRSLALAQFAQVFSDSYEFIVLQKDVSMSEQVALASQPHVREFSASISDFSDTAALCELVDLVVTVDTSVAHLAGALGRPAWVLLAYQPDWRWLLRRPDSPWYPSASLYRQTQRNDWQTVVMQVRADLDNAAHVAPDACPVCGTATVLHDVVDFNKSCGEANGRFLPLSGKAIYYQRCPGCGLTQAPEFRQWSAQDFREHIYNEAYAEVDPDSVSARPLANAKFVHELFGESRGVIRHLDYAGNGALSAGLRENQWNSVAYDPFAADAGGVAGLGKFDLVTAFGVFERAPDVAALMQDLGAVMDEECVLIFSTRFSDGQIEPNRQITWWFASPRNGHITLFTKQSLVLLAEQSGLQFGSFNEDTHCLFRRLPAWAKKLTGG